MKKCCLGEFMKKSYHIINYGCQMNESDAEHFAGQLEDMGYAYNPDFHQADVILINTCCVRESAEKKILGKIGEMKAVKAAHPQKVICVTGCMAQKSGKKLLTTYPQVDLLIGTAHVNNFRGILESYLAGRKHAQHIFTDLEQIPEEFEGNFVRKSSFSAWVPIMYGCNNFCTYCIVPYVRGRERSRSKENIIAEISKAVGLGYKEFTLLGQNVNSYGKDSGAQDAFSDLLTAVDAIPGVERVRYMTSHPRDMDEGVVKAVAASKHICHHFHIPVQSGSNKIIKAMNRGYTREKYLGLVKLIRSYVPDAVITTDLIVGFPGETQEDFEDTLKLLEEVSYDVAYTFIYSKRSGTPAAKMANQVPPEIKQERLEQLMAVQNKHSLKHNEKLVGRTLEVLVEGPSHNNPLVWSGRTDGNKLVLWPKGQDNFVIGSKLNIKIEAAQTWLLKGRPSYE
jgi:tRNA-2-methylthio-N6-dimethylallyladenosine synthase